MRSLPLAAAAFALLAAAPVHDARVQEGMKTIVDPASATLFAVGGEVDPENGPDAAKVPAARWAAAAEAAGKLKAEAAVLLKPEVVRPGEWKADAEKMAALSAAAETAAKTKNGKALAQAANDLGDVCTACHTPYKPKG